MGVGVDKLFTRLVIFLIIKLYTWRYNVAVVAFSCLDMDYFSYAFKIVLEFVFLLACIIINYAYLSVS